MLPDFTQAKARANTDLLRWMRHQVPSVAPLIQGISKFRQHEGRIGTLVRHDRSTDTIEYTQQSFQFTADREEMKHFDLATIQRKFTDLAKQIGEAQTKRLLEVAGQP